VPGPTSDSAPLTGVIEHPDLVTPYTLWLAAYTEPYDG
jgi:hypothetical protein